MANILIVEDDPDLRQLFLQLLSQEGHDCTACGAAEDADEALAARPPDLAILDINLPGEHGVSLAWRIRQLHPSLPLIVTSAELEAWEREDIEDCGADRILEKPIPPDRLIALVREMLARPIAGA